MYRGNSVGVVVPAYEEAGFVGDVIRAIPAYVDRVYVVDDASTDDTWSEIRTAAREVDEASGEDQPGGLESTADEPARPADDSERSAADPESVAAPGTPDGGRRVVPIRHEENRGVGGAIKTGYRRARADDLDVTAVMAGDGQMDPAYLDHLLDPVVEGRAEYAKGNRLVRPEWRAEMPRFRLVGNAVLTLLTKVASGYWRVGDPQNGYAAISRDALDDADVDGMYEFYGYCNDLLVRLAVADARVADVPIPPSYGDEQSTIELRTYVPRVSAMLLRTFTWRLAASFRRDRHPAGFLYAAAALLGLAGLRDAVGRLLSATRDRASGGENRPLARLLSSVVLLAGAVVVDWVFGRQRGFRERRGD